MNRILKIPFSMFLGAWAGLLAWAILDLAITQKTFDAAFPVGTPLAIYVTAAITGALVGLLTGLLITALEKWNDSSRALPTLIGAGIGIAAGFLSGMLGLLIAEAFFQAIRAPGDVTTIARVVGWALFGLGVGIAPGLATGSPRKAIASSVGGFFGGILGGLALTILSSLTNFPMTGRAVGFTLLGALVGLLIALVQELVKQAELKIISGGRNEGREFKIDKARVTIGAHARNDWVINHDPYLMPNHVEITQARGQFTLRALDPNAPTAVNNQIVVTQLLNNGDQIQVGSTMLLFRVR